MLIYENINYLGNMGSQFLDQEIRANLELHEIAIIFTPFTNFSNVL